MPPPFADFWAGCIRNGSLRRTIPCFCFGDPEEKRQETRDALIEELRQRLAAPVEPPRFRPGERVQLRGGTFNELEAIFVSADGEERSVILLTLLQREQKVRVPTRYLSGCVAQTGSALGCRAD